MKKAGICSLVVALLLSCCVWVTSYAAIDKSAYNVTYSDEISIKAQTGFAAGGNSGWGNHESRIVHTSHGDYAAYCTDQIEYNDVPGAYPLRLTGIAIFKIADDGTTTCLLHDYRGYESSGVTAFTDGDENVWMVEVGDSRIRTQGASGVHVTAYRVDAKTDEVVAYSATYNVYQEGSGFGYGSAAYDPYTNKIIAETADGDPSYGNEDKGTLEWFLFDIATLTWEPTVHQVEVGNRYCYPYIMPDGKGGMYIIAGRDFRCTSAGYPEIDDHTTGLDWNSLTKEQKRFRNYDQGAGYVWDSIKLFYIPDITVSEVASFWVEEADYSKVLGSTFEERCTFENRLNSWYPNFQMNNGGDAYIDKEGYLHIIWYKQYLYAALTRAEADCMFYHDVYDIRNVKSAADFSEAIRISRSEIKNNVTDLKKYSFRLYEDAKGNLYYISVDSKYKTSTATDCQQKIKNYDTTKSYLKVYALEGTPEKGYTFTQLTSKSLTCEYVVNISNRGGRLNDGHIGVLVYTSGDYRYYNINVVKTEPLSGVNVSADKETVREGETITWTAEAIGGKAPTYKFDLYNGEELVTSTTYATGNEFSYTPETSGNYRVKAYVKESTKSFTAFSEYTEVIGQLTSVTATSDKTKVALNEKITWTASALGGIDVQYGFYLYLNGQIIETQRYGSSNVYSYTPTVDGIYKVKALAMSDGVVVIAGSNNVIVSDPLTSVSAVADKATAKKGEEITWTASSVGGINVKYAFYLYKGSTIVDRQLYSTSNTYSYIPKEDGTYKVKVLAMSESTQINNVGDAVTVFDPLTSVSATADKTSSAKGEKITWTATAVGGRNVKFAFYLYNGSTLVDKQLYSTSNTFSYSPEEEGIYKVKVFAMSDSTQVAFVTAAVTVSAPLTSVSAVADKTSVAKGETITWTSTAVGGLNVKYAFYLYKGSEIIDKQLYSASNTYSFKFDEAGTYNVKLLAMSGTTQVISAAGKITVSEE